MKRKLHLGLLGLSFMGLMTACSEDYVNNNGGENVDGSQSSFVVAATLGEANKLLKSDALNSGTISANNAGKVTDLGTTWIYYQDKYLYRLVYNQGNAGLSSSYEMSQNGTIEERDYSYEIPRFTSFGIYNNYIITSFTGDLGSSYAVLNGYLLIGFLFSYLVLESENIRTNRQMIFT